jgi:hypothetical protein
MSANIKASTDGTQAIIGVGGVDQMTVSNAGVVTANSFVGAMNSSSVTATGSTTARTLANRFADVVNVKDFGAVGNGVANDTAAIQAAIDFAYNNNGGVVYIPKGTYLTKSTILAKDNVTLVGDGAESEIKSASDSVYWTNNTGIYDQVFNAYIIILIASVSNFSVRNIKFDSSAVTPSSPMPPGGGQNWFRAVDIYTFVGNNITIDSCEFISAGGATAFLDANFYYVTNNKIKCQAVDSKDHTDGIIDQWRNNNNFVILNNTVDGNNIGKWGILVTANTGFAPSNMNNFKVLNNTVNNTYRSIHVMGRDGTCEQFIVCNNTTKNSSDFGILVTDSKKYNCSNNIISNSYNCGLYIAREYPQFSGTGTIAGTTLTISSVNYGTIVLGGADNRLSGTGVTNTYILSQLSGTPGGIGTYQLSSSQTIGPVTVYVGNWWVSNSGFESCIVNGNVVSDIGISNLASNTSIEKSAIAIFDGNNNSSGIISHNTVNGSTHSYSVYLGSNGIEHIGGTYKIGLAGAYTNVGSGGIIRQGTESPQSFKWVRSSETDILSQIKCEITTALAYQELLLNDGGTKFNQISGSGVNTALEIARVNNSQTGILVFPDSSAPTGPTIATNSSSANSDLRLQPKGTGLVSFGTRIASSDTPITGYIEIKDSTGNTRRLAVIN